MIYQVHAVRRKHTHTMANVITGNYNTRNHSGGTTAATQVHLSERH